MKVALVTGASKGLGRALSEELVKQGYQVVGVARSEECLKELETSLGSHAFVPFVCDVSQPGQVQRVSKEMEEKNLIPTLFLLNAGIAGEAACENPFQFDLSIHRELFNTNYFGVLHWVEQWLPICLKGQGASFVAIGSVNALFVPPIGSGYSASKAAVGKSFEGLGLAYHDTNVLFSTIYAGPIKTEGLKGSVPFVWEPERLARYILRKVGKRKTHIENSLFYSIICRILPLLPYSLTRLVLGNK